MSLFLRCRRVFIAQKTVWRLVFLNFRETTYWRLEAVVGIVIVTLADFSDQDCTCSRFYFKIMVHSLHNADAHSRFQADLRACRNYSGLSVDMDCHIILLINRLIRQRIKNTDQDVSTASVDDILHLVPVKMIRSVLSLF